MGSGSAAHQKNGTKSLRNGTPRRVAWASSHVVNQEETMLWITSPHRENGTQAFEKRLPSAIFSRGGSSGAGHGVYTVSSIFGRRLSRCAQSTGQPWLALGPRRWGRIWHQPAPNWHFLTGAVASVAPRVREGLIACRRRRAPESERRVCPAQHVRPIQPSCGHIAVCQPDGSAGLASDANKVLPGFEPCQLFLKLNLGNEIARENNLSEEEKAVAIEREGHKDPSTQAKRPVNSVQTTCSANFGTVNGASLKGAEDFGEAPCRGHGPE
jgi:hypothetical protein